MNDASDNKHVRSLCKRYMRIDGAISKDYMHAWVKAQLKNIQVSINDNRARNNGIINWVHVNQRCVGFIASCIDDYMQLNGFYGTADAYFSWKQQEMMARNLVEYFKSKKENQ